MTAKTIKDRTKMKTELPHNQYSDESVYKKVIIWIILIAICIAIGLII